MPAERGNLYDRHGRPLALSVITWRMGVAGRLVEDASAERPGATCWARSWTRRARLSRRLDRAGQQATWCWPAGVVLTPSRSPRCVVQQAVTLDTVRSRVYPTDGVGASLRRLLPARTPTATIATGLEHSLDGYLAGRPGRAREIDTANPGQDLGQVVLQEAVHGQTWS